MKKLEKNTEFVILSKKYPEKTNSDKGFSS